jgi:hypothetical protein
MATLTIPFPNFQNGQPIVASQHNSNNTAIANFSNGLSAGLNFDNGAIGTASIAGQAITTALIADANVTSVKLAASLTLTTPVLGVASATSITVGTVAGLSVPTNGVLVQGNVVYHLAINPQTATYTLVLADDGKLIEILSATAVNVNIPLESSVAFPIGTQITVLQTGTGQLTLVPAVGVTLNGNPGVKTRGQWTAATLIKRAANIWIALGDLSA